MKNLIALIVLVGFSEFASCQTCQLQLGKDKESKLTKLQKGAVDALKLDITYDCENVECNPLEDADVQVEKSNKTGCRCEREVKEGVPSAYSCRCCFRIKKWNFLMCLASAVELVSPFKFSIFVTFDGHVFSRLTIPLKAIADKYIPVCIPVVLPPPVEWLSPCFKFKFEVPSPSNNNVWRICGKIKIGIYLIPIWTIYTKCFEISDKVDSMKIEGQTNYDQEVQEPAKVKVKDKKNMSPLICLSNKKKDKAVQCKNSRSCPVPIAPIELDTKINWQESTVELSPFVVVLYSENSLIPVQELQDDDAYPFLQEAVREAQAQQWMEPKNKNPGAICGGALLTADKVLTICACVRSFYAAHKLKKDVYVDEDDGFRFDITSNEINLKFADASLASGKYLLDTDGKKMIPNSVCSKDIETNQPAEVLQTSMIVMPITPTIKGSKDKFVFWPPGILKPASTVSLVAYGMKSKNAAWVFKNKSGGKIDFQNTAVDFSLKKCPAETDYCTSEIGKQKPVDKPIKDRLSCMCAAKADFQLFDGVIGFPLTTDKQLLGLTSLPVDNGTEGSTLGAIFDASTVREIENYVGKNNLRPSSVVGMICQNPSPIIRILPLIATHFYCFF